MARMSRWLVGSSSSSRSGSSAKARARAARRISPPDRPARGLGRIEAEGLPAPPRPVQGSAPPAVGVVEQGLAGDVRLLRHDRRCAVPGWTNALAGVGLDLAGHDAHQGRLAGAVAADQAGAGARLERQVDAVEQLHRPVRQADVVQSEDGRAGAMVPRAHGWRAGSGAASALRPLRRGRRPGRRRSSARAIRRRPPVAHGGRAEVAGRQSPWCAASMNRRQIAAGQVAALRRRASAGPRSLPIQTPATSRA